MELTRRKLTGKLTGTYAIIDRSGAAFAPSLDGAFELASDRLKMLIDNGVEKEYQMVVVAKILAIVEP